MPKKGINRKKRPAPRYRVWVAGRMIHETDDADEAIEWYNKVSPGFAAVIEILMFDDAIHNWAYVVYKNFLKVGTINEEVDPFVSASGSPYPDGQGRGGSRSR